MITLNLFSVPAFSQPVLYVSRSLGFGLRVLLSLPFLPLYTDSIHCLDIASEFSFCLSLPPSVTIGRSVSLMYGAGVLCLYVLLCKNLQYIYIFYVYMLMLSLLHHEIVKS